MEWLRQMLKDVGMEDSKIDAIIADANKEVPKHFIPKDKFNDLTNTKNQLEKDIQARDTQLEELKITAGASDELKARIQTLQDENKTAKEQYEADLKDLTMTNAIKLALNGKVHDEDLASGLIDKAKLVLGDDGKIVGLDEQLTSLKESKAFLFKPDESQQQQQQSPPPGFKVGGNGQGTPPSEKGPSLMDAISSHFSTQK